MSRPRNILVKDGPTLMSVQPSKLKTFLRARASGNAGAVLMDAKVLSSEGLVVVTALGPDTASLLLGALFPTEPEAVTVTETAATTVEANTVATA